MITWSKPLTQLSPSLYADLIGKPFAADARGPDAYDCVGLAAEVQRRLGRRLPEFVSCAAELHRQLTLGGVLSDSHRLADPEAGCVAFLRSLGGPGGPNRHLGVMVDPYRLLHASEGAGSVVVESLTRSLWGKRVLGFYTMEAQAQ